MRGLGTTTRRFAVAAFVASGLAAIPGVVWAAAAGVSPRFGPLLFAVAMLVLAAKAGGMLAERWRQPPVLWELLVGIVLGNLLPPILGGMDVATLRTDPTLLFLAQIGVLILLFDVGLDADLRALARVGPSSLLVALIGVVVPVSHSQPRFASPATKRRRRGL